VKVRVMFTQNIHVPPRYDAYQNDNKYFLLYYQFVKHCFGLNYSEEEDSIRVRLYLDQMPDTKEKVQSFKDHITAINKSALYRHSPAYFDRDQIAEIDSKHHVLAEALDIVLGSMQFRLNDKHLAKPPGSARRGKRTIAKEKLYKRINARIRGIYPGFNIGSSTGTQGDNRNRWIHPYRHWNFRPKGGTIDLKKGKQKK